MTPIQPPADDGNRSGRRTEAIATGRQDQARRQRSSRLLLAGGAVALVVIVAATVVVVGLHHKPQAAATTTAETGVTEQVASIPTSTFDAVGIGTALAAPRPIQSNAKHAYNGKPQVLYVGAEFCPFCAGERWVIAAALARFGTFKELGQTESSPTDRYPSTRTLSFHGSTYTSPYLTFTAYETQTNTGERLDTLTGADFKTEQTYNAPPYEQGKNGIPFIDIANQFLSVGASYDVGVLQGMSHAQIAAAMQDPRSDVAQAVDGAANLFIATVCQATGEKPGAVCTSDGVRAAEQALQSTN